MKTKSVNSVCFLAALLMLWTGSSVAHAGDLDVLLQWNRLAQSLYGTGPGLVQRTFSMMHIAMFDAVNAVEGDYTPYIQNVPRARGGSAEAAAAQAAHDVLIAVFPAQQTAFDTLLSEQLAGIPSGRARLGIDVGRKTARAVLAWRHDDGWPTAVVPDPAYVLPPFQGNWQPTPPGNSAASFTFYPNVKPFAMLSSTQFLPPPPPTLTSARYAQDLNETKQLGSAGSLLRTSDQTLMAQITAAINTSTGIVQAWNMVAGITIEQERMSLVDAARAFALLNVSIHDGLQTSFTSKYVYAFWRPVAAIRRADEDMNLATDPDPSWTPLLNTPPYPSYAGNVACLSSAASRALQLAFGRDDVRFSVTWTRTGGLPNVTLTFNRFSEMAEAQARSRIHGGIHFQFESEASQTACPKVTEFANSHYMRPRR